MSIKWGILGTGGIAREFAADVRSHTDMAISAVGSRSLAKAEAFDSNVRAYGSYEELVSSDVDAIYVATPHQVHAENTILALNAGKPVLCEKPFAINANEAKAMASTAKENNLLLMEAMWTRYLPHIQKVRELMHELGEVLNVQADHGQSLMTIKRLTDPNYAGGALLDLGIYPVSFTYFVFGRPEKITSKSVIENGVDLQTSAIFEYSDGRQALINTVMNAKTPTCASINGTKARLELQTSFYRPTDMRLVYNNGRIVEFKNEYRGHGLREQAIYFEKLLISGKKDSELLPIAETISIMETMDEIRNQIGLKYPFEN
ncbi:MAG: Gfo/Idh/MocA family protein [Candidatus Nanopelagicaceae bacterium]